MEVLYFVVGVVVGIIATILASRFRSPGTVVIDHSDPDMAFPFLESTLPLSEFERRKYATLKIEKRNYLSQK